MLKKGRGLVAALCGAGLAVLLSAAPAAAQGTILTQSERDFVTLDNAATPAKGHPNLMGLIGYTDAGDGGVKLGAWYDMPLSDRMAAVFGANATIVDDTWWNLNAGVKYQLGNLGSSNLHHAVIGRLGYWDGPGDGAFGGELRWAATYLQGNNSFSANLGLGLREGESIGVPFGLGWTHRFSGKWRAGLEWGGEIYKGDLYSEIGPSIWYYLPTNSVGGTTSIGASALFGVGENDGWSLNAMGQWAP